MNRKNSLELAVALDVVADALATHNPDAIRDLSSNIRQGALEMTPDERRDISTWMQTCYYGGWCDNATSLAEAAAHEFDVDDFLDDPDHEIWHMAIEYYED